MVRILGGTSDSKGRGFQAELRSLAVSGLMLHEYGGGVVSKASNRQFPAQQLAAFGHSQAMAVFAANIADGRTFFVGDKHHVLFHFPKGVDVRVEKTRLGVSPSGSSVMLYEWTTPDLWATTPMQADAEHIRFLAAPPASLMDRRYPADVYETIEHFFSGVKRSAFSARSERDTLIAAYRSIAPAGAYVIEMLTRRSAYPIPIDPAFRMYLFLRLTNVDDPLFGCAMSSALANRLGISSRRGSDETIEIGLTPSAIGLFAVNISKSNMEQLLMESIMADSGGGTWQDRLRRR